MTRTTFYLSTQVLMLLFLLQKALAQQKHAEDMRRLAEIEREARPLTRHDVREKFRSKLPVWKQLQLSSQDKSSSKQSSSPPQPPEDQEEREREEEEGGEMVGVARGAAPDEECEFISEFPFSIAPKEEKKEEGGGRRGQSATTKEKTKESESKKVAGHSPYSFSQNRQSWQRYSLGKTQSDTAAGGTSAPDPVVAAPKASSVLEGLRGLEREEKLREKLTFKIGKPSSSSSASSATAQDVDTPTVKSGPAPQSADVAKETMAVSSNPLSASVKDTMVEYTGEVQQDSSSSAVDQVPCPPSEQHDDAPPTYQLQEAPPTTTTTAASQPAAEVRVPDPETGMMEGEPGEIMEDSAAGGTEEEGEGEGRVLEEGEMEEEGGACEDEDGGRFEEEERGYVSWSIL